LRGLASASALLTAVCRGVERRLEQDEAEEDAASPWPLSGEYSRAAGREAARGFLEGECGLAGPAWTYSIRWEAALLPLPQGRGQCQVGKHDNRIFPRGVPSLRLPGQRPPGGGREDWRSSFGFCSWYLCCWQV
jgi:hypothetical protein